MRSGGPREILAQHQVEFELAADLPMLVLDPVLLEQVFLNLLDNAAKYTPPGTRIAFSAGASDAVVPRKSSTTARGSPADLEQVFDKFYRAPEATVCARDRARARDLARLHRSHARDASAREPVGPVGSRPLTDHACRPGTSADEMDTAA